MLGRLFPEKVDNNYQGRIVAKWIFVLITSITILRSLIHMVAADGGAQSIATIPLDSFTQNGSSTVVHIFALWGLSQLLLGIVFVVVIWRYQSLIPFMYLLIIIEYSIRIVFSIIKPIKISGIAPGGIGNYLLVPLGIIMFIFSLKKE